MAYVTLFVFFLLTHLLLLHSAEGVERTYPDCSPFNCGKFGIISFPIVRPLIVENSVLSAFHSLISHTDCAVYCQ